MRDFGKGFLDSELSMIYTESHVMLFLKNHYTNKANDITLSIAVTFDKEVGAAENYEGIASLTVISWMPQATKKYNCDTICELIDWFADGVQCPLTVGDWEFLPSMYRNCIRVVNKKHNIDETFDVPKWTQYSKRVARHIEMFLAMYQYEHCNK